jgi:hypothetical protein
MVRRAAWVAEESKGGTPYLLEMAALFERAGLGHPLGLLRWAYLARFHTV